MHGASRWKPPRVPLSTGDGSREHRPGYRGHLWVVVPARAALGLLPWLGPAEAPDGGHGFYGMRLDCTGRMDRVTGWGSRAQAEESCAVDASRVAGYEAEEFERTGKRPRWERMPRGSRMTLGTGIWREMYPRLLWWPAVTWRARKLADMTRKPREARVPAGTGGRTRIEVITEDAVDAEIAKLVAEIAEREAGALGAERIEPGNRFC